MQLLRDSLRSLRSNFRDQDPEQHTLDTLEQGIVSLMDRLHVLHTHRVLARTRTHTQRSTTMAILETESLSKTN